MHFPSDMLLKTNGHENILKLTSSQEDDNKHIGKKSKLAELGVGGEVPGWEPSDLDGREVNETSGKRIWQCLVSALSPLGPGNSMQGSPLDKLVEMSKKRRAGMFLARQYKAGENTI